MALSTRVSALIVAAGRGSRAGENGPKQYALLGGQPMLSRTIRAFTDHPRVSDVRVVIHADDLPKYEAAIASLGICPGAPIIGGATRQASVRAGLDALAQEPPDVVLIHDAARPLVDGGLIGRVIAALDRADAALPVLPVADTLKRGANGNVVETIPRDGLYRAQTPQGFRYGEILDAHQAAAKAGRSDFTDDAAIAEWQGIQVALVDGSEHNYKITTAEDLALAQESLMRDDARGFCIRVGSGFDVHAFGPGDGVTLCGLRIPHTHALIGHSDADVALHALTDAILGALGEGDIGMHFPPAEPRWAGAASEMFLRDAVFRTHDKGGTVEHLDLTIICETPKISPHRNAFRASIASIAGIDEARISVKATTTERLGFTGRGEGIAAMATATVRLP